MRTFVKYVFQPLRHFFGFVGDFGVLFYPLEVVVVKGFSHFRGHFFVGGGGKRSAVEKLVAFCKNHTLAYVLCPFGFGHIAAVKVHDHNGQSKLF